MTKACNRKTSPFLLSGRFLTQTHILCSSICTVQHMTFDYFNIEGQYGKNRIWSVDSPHQTWWGVGSLDWLGNLGSFAGFRSSGLWYRSPEAAHKHLSYKRTRTPNEYICATMHLSSFLPELLLLKPTPFSFFLQFFHLLHTVWLPPCCQEEKAKSYRWDC